MPSDNLSRCYALISAFKSKGLSVSVERVLTMGITLLETMIDLEESGGSLAMFKDGRITAIQFRQLITNVSGKSLQIAEILHLEAAKGNNQ